MKKGSDVNTAPPIDVYEARTHHRLSDNLWSYWAEAATVSLARFHAPPPPLTRFEVRPSGRDAHQVQLGWPEPDDRARESHANELDATEAGAYAVAAIAVHAVDKWRVRGRANHASGADLLMLRDDDDPGDFVRLEASGMAKCAPSKLRARLREKVNQLGRGDLQRPGLAVVVGFELAHVLISEVQT